MLRRLSYSTPRVTRPFVGMPFNAGSVSHSAAIEEILRNVLHLFGLLLIGKLLSWLWRLRCSYFKKGIVPTTRKRQQVPLEQQSRRQHLEQKEQPLPRQSRQQQQQPHQPSFARAAVARRHRFPVSEPDLCEPSPLVVRRNVLGGDLVQASAGLVARQSVQEFLADTQLRPQHSRRIESRNEFWELVRIGQHYAVQRSLLGICIFHHFLISEVSPSGDFVKVIHYNGTARRYIETAKKVFGEVVEDTVWHDDDDLLDIPRHLYIVDDPKYPTTAVTSAAAASAVDAVARARRRLGECRYGMTYNNCEHFVRWALTGLPRCDQYDLATVGFKVIASLVDELPHFGIHLLVKCSRDACYGIASAVESMVLEGGARLIQHTAEVSLPAVASTAAATAGLAVPAEAAYLAFRILDMKRRLADGTLCRRDYDNAKDKAITSAVLSLVCSTCGAVVGQLFVPLPLLGALFGSFLGGVFGRLGGASVAAFGIALKEKYLYDYATTATASY